MANIINSPIGACFPLIPDIPFSTTQPYTYRNTQTLLLIYGCLQNAIEELRDQVNENAESSDKMQQALRKTLQDTIDTLNKTLEQMRDELTEMVQSASKYGSAWNPAYGHYEDLQSILDDIYDADRLHGLFVSDFDNLGLSPKQFDDLQVSPRRFDLDSTDVKNAVKGDVDSSNITWLSHSEARHAKVVQ